MRMASEQALQFLEANLDIEKLINEVQNRPALWDMTQKDYSDRIKRKQCWEEITALVSSGSDLTLHDKNILGDTLHKKWKNIRDRFTRDIQERKGKSGDGARKKAPYMYSQQLEFLRDTVTPRRTVSSLESAENTSIEEEVHEDEQDEHQEATSASSTRSDAPRILHTKVRQIGKKRLHPVEEQLLRSLDLYEKRTRIDKEKEKVEDKNDNRHFLLSLEQSLASLPRHSNTSCRIEIMQCINKYETRSQQHQQPLTYLQTIHSYPGHQQYNPQRHHQSQLQPHHFQTVHNTQMYIPHQLQSSSLYTSNQLQSESHQYPPRTFMSPRPTPSPVESAASYTSNQLQSESQQYPPRTFMSPRPTPSPVESEDDN